MAFRFPAAWSACRAGGDSVALLDLLLTAGHRRLVVCHLDHGLRARASAADARFVARLAETHGLPFETARADVRALARAEKLSLETAAREARYRFFADVAARRRLPARCFWPITPTTQAETFLFNLLRASGPGGARGHGGGKASGRVGRRVLRIVRPLLGVWREEIDAYVRARGHEMARGTPPTPTPRPRHPQRPARRGAAAALTRHGARRAPGPCGARRISCAPRTPGFPLCSPAMARHPPNCLSRRYPRSLWRGSAGPCARGWRRGASAGWGATRRVERVRTLLDTAGGGPAKVNPARGPPRPAAGREIVRGIAHGADLPCRRMFSAAPIPTADKPSLYALLDAQLRALLTGERDWLANFANAAALLFHTLPDLNWAGFYLLRGEELVLGPFQGKTGLRTDRAGPGRMRGRGGATPLAGGGGRAGLPRAHRLRRRLARGIGRAAGRSRADYRRARPGQSPAGPLRRGRPRGL